MLILISYIVLMTILYMSLREEIVMSAYMSSIFGSYKNNYFLMYIMVLVFPFVLFKFIKFVHFKNILMKIKLKYLVYATGLFLLGYVFSMSGKYYNQSATIRLAFDKTMNSRLVSLNNIKVTVAQKFQLSKINDSSFYKSLIAITTNRADGAQLMFKLVTENNPNANFEVVSSMYQEVSASIDRERNKLIAIENELASLDNEYRSLHTLIPSCIFLFFEQGSLNYKAISTMENKVINVSGIDSNVYIK